MQIIQRLLRRVPKQAVRIPLERGQVIERRGLFSFFLSFHVCDGRRVIIAFLRLRFGFRPDLIFFAHGGKGIENKIDRVKSLRLKGAYFRLPLHQQRKRRRYHAPHVQGAMIHHGKQAGGVDAHQPVRLAAAEGGGVEVVVLRAVAEIVKAIKDRRILHGGDPEPLYALAAVVEIIRRAEDQLALASGVAGVDDLANVLSVHEGAEGVHLLLLVP